MAIKIKLMGGEMPVYKHTGDACADCYVRNGIFHKLNPLETMKVPLGFAVELPEGYEAVIRPRSSVSLSGLHVSTGTIDSNYRGEVCCIITNLTTEAVIIKGGTRLCQMKIQKADQFDFTESEELSNSDRGENGFGSTGC